MKCEKCGKEILDGGVGLEYDNGMIIDICSSCIKEIGKEVKETRKCEWVENLLKGSDEE